MRVGAIDIGTNSTRLLIADVVDGHIAEVEHAVVVTRLGQGVDRSGALAACAMTRTVDVLADFAQRMDAALVTARRAVATSATRDAANAFVFLDAAEAALGVRPEIIDGIEEARLSFAGALHGKDLPSALVIDVGGGSTEFVAGSTRPEYLMSVDIGSVRLTERMPERPPVSPGDIARARREVAALFADALDLPATEAVIGVAGTYSTLAAVHLRLAEHDREIVDGTVLSAGDVDALVRELGTMTIAEIAAIPSMDPGRAPVILGGAIVADEALRASGHDQLTVSESDILDGIALAMTAIP